MAKLDTSQCSGWAVPAFHAVCDFAAFLAWVTKFFPLVTCGTQALSLTAPSRLLALMGDLPCGEVKVGVSLSLL